jgi:hypothetical protein
MSNFSGSYRNKRRTASVSKGPNTPEECTASIYENYIIGVVELRCTEEDILRETEEGVLRAVY